MNNVFYGKTMQNFINRIDVKLVNSEKDYLNWTSKPNYMSQKIFNKDLVAMPERKITLKLTKPTYVGICVLDLSKLLVYEFLLDYIKNKYGSRFRISFTDTDRLMYETKTDYVYEDFRKNKKMFGLVIIQPSQNLMMIQIN